jgi:hypothetical protein
MFRSVSVPFPFPQNVPQNVWEKMKFLWNARKVSLRPMASVPKKMRVISDLVCKVYDDELAEFMLMKTVEDDFRPRIIFKNKPEQMFSAMFIMKDNWCDIKRKMNKLVESDGICVVCFETETFEKMQGGKFPVGDSKYCFNCCEMICEGCYDKLKTNECVVCRKDLGNMCDY